MRATQSLAQPDTDSVVISASRSAQRSFDAPAAIDTVERAEIQDSGPQVNLSESLRRIPGLTILNRQNYAQDLQVSIRGFGARSAFGLRGIRLLIDGIPATTPDGQGQGSSVSLTSTERIEVLRGPLAQLYGNASGGVIQAFTREAPTMPEFLNQFYSGSYGLRRSDWQYAGKRGEYGVVADYSAFELDGYREHSHAQRKQFNGRLSVEPDRQTRVDVVFNRFEMPEAEDPLGLTAAQLAASPAQAGTGAITARTRKITVQNQLGTSVKYQIDKDRRLTARAYFGTRNNLQYQANNTWVAVDRNYYGVALQYDQRLRIGGRAVALLAGYDFDYSSERRQGGDARGGEKRLTPLTRDEDDIARNNDFFVQATTLATDAITLTTGVRVSAVDAASTDRYLVDGDGSGSARYHALSPVLGLTYHATDRLNMYANYGKGFETPTLAELAYSDNGAAAVNRFNPTLKASNSKHYEVGAKWLPTPHSRFDLNLFQIDAADEIVVAASSTGRTSFKNAPSTRRTGLELSGRVLIDPHVRALLAATSIDARFAQGYRNSTSQVAAGNRLPGIARSFIFSELLWSSKAFDIAAPEGSRAGTRAALELASAGRMFANDTNTVAADGYTTVNTSVSQEWAIGAARLTGYGRIENLANRRYVGSLIVNQAAGQYFEPAPGRNWTLGVRLVVPL